MRPTADGNSVDLEYEASNEKLDRWAETHGAPPIIVATGFIAKDPKVAFICMPFKGRSFCTESLYGLDVSVCFFQLLLVQLIAEAARTAYATSNNKFKATII